MLLAVCAAISAATSELGWLMSFGLQCAFFWAVFLQRRSLTEGLVGAVTGPGVPGGGRALEILALYSGARLGTRAISRPVRSVGSRLRRGRSARTATGSPEGAQSPSAQSPDVAPAPAPTRASPSASGRASRSDAPAPAGETETIRAERAGARARKDSTEPRPRGDGAAAPAAGGEETRAVPSNEAGQEPRNAGKGERQRTRKGASRRKEDASPQAQTPKASRPTKSRSAAPSTGPTTRGSQADRDREGGLAEELRADAERAQGAQVPKPDKLPERRTGRGASTPAEGADGEARR